MEVEVRRALPDDAGDICRLTPQLGYETGEQELRARLEGFAGDDHRVLLAVGDGRVVGWIHVALRASVESAAWSEILGFVVDQDARGQGIGTRLLRAGGDWAAGRGVDRMRVRSKSSRRAAHRFYEARGFRFVKEQRVMDLDLTSSWIT